MDATSSGRGVRQFKTYLLHRLEKVYKYFLGEGKKKIQNLTIIYSLPSLFQEEVETKPQLAKNDPREIQAYYQNFYEKYIKEGETSRKP